MTVSFLQTPLNEWNDQSMKSDQNAVNQRPTPTAAPETVPARLVFDFSAYQLGVDRERPSACKHNCRGSCAEWQRPKIPTKFDTPATWFLTTSATIMSYRFESWTWPLLFRCRSILRLDRVLHHHVVYSVRGLEILGTHLHPR